MYLHKFKTKKPFNEEKKLKLKIIKNHFKNMTKFCSTNNTTNKFSILIKVILKNNFQLNKKCTHTLKFKQTHTYKHTHKEEMP